jgi:hypothetical protein
MRSFVTCTLHTVLIRLLLFSMNLTYRNSSTFRVPRLRSIFRCRGRSKESKSETHYGTCQFFMVSGGWEFFSSPPRPYRLWVPPGILSSGYLGALSAGVKWPGREADHSPPASAEVKNTWRFTSAPKLTGHTLCVNDCFWNMFTATLPVLLSEHYAMKAYWGSVGIAPLIIWPRD